MAKKTKAKKETGLYMLECISIHKIRYCVEADQKAVDKIKNEFRKDGATELTEFSQDHLDEILVSIHPIPDKNSYLKIFDEDNAYLARWDDEKKFEFINKLFKK